MLNLTEILPAEYQHDTESQQYVHRISENIQVDGEIYYRYPNLSVGKSAYPQLTVIAKNYASFIINTIEFSEEDLEKVTSEYIQLQGSGLKDNPVALFDDMLGELRQKLSRNRDTRPFVVVMGILVTPLWDPDKFRTMFTVEDDVIVVKNISEVDWDRLKLENRIADGVHKALVSIIQGIGGMTRGAIAEPTKTTRMDEAIFQLERKLKMMDQTQQKASLSFHLGPQCIRGLAGTGKTILLALKAAFLHERFPQSKILYTFNTQSLYNSVIGLVTTFYRQQASADPDFDYLHIRHAWGSRQRAGVYSDACARIGLPPLTLTEAKTRDTMPLRACCAHLSDHNIQPYYDHVLIDEAQDFPSEFSSLIWNLTKDPHNICFAYDELQSLADVEMPELEHVFGTNSEGVPRWIPEESDITVLKKSYRCPGEVLVLAHAVGLGIYNEDGPVQMIESTDTWESIGYNLQGVLEAGNKVVLTRPEENSPSILGHIYKGPQHFIMYKAHENRTKEIEWVANEIDILIHSERVRPQDIVVTSLDSLNSRHAFSLLQQRLLELGIQSVIPGLVQGSAQFMEEGRVTLSTVFRVKGNEAPVVFVLAVDELYTQEDIIQIRNRLFTCISRSKGWIRLTGTGSGMDRAMREFDRVRKHYPSMEFVFPDMKTIRRRLDPQIQAKKRLVLNEYDRFANVLHGLDEETIKEMGLEELVTALRRMRSHDE